MSWTRRTFSKEFKSKVAFRVTKREKYDRHFSEEV